MLNYDNIDIIFKIRTYFLAKYSLEDIELLKDKEIKLLCERENSKTYVMSLNGDGVFCNPTAENIIKEMLLGLKLLFKDFGGVSVWGIKLYETPNCSVETFVDGVTYEEEVNFNYKNENFVLHFKEYLGI